MPSVITSTTSRSRNSVRPAAAVLTVMVSAVAVSAGAVARDREVRVGGTPHAVPSVDSAVVIDGDLSEPAWDDALALELAYEVTPGENVDPPVRTEVLLLHDETNVYFAFRAFDPDPAAIRAHLAARDDLGADDWVGVVLDTFNDERRCFDLLVNPLGVQADQIEVTGGSSQEWDAVWHAAARITTWGYAVEIGVPFSSLRFQRADGPQVWGFDAVRSYPRSVRHHIGVFPRDRSNNCYLCQAVKIRGFAGVVPGRNLEIVPTLTSVESARRSELPGGSMEGDGAEAEAGVTARWGVTPNVTLSGTLNPDFSQVEADALQLDVNEPFALFFPEKRPFFMEGSDIFATELDVVYTRAVRDPSWGAKLSGKAGSDTLGVFVARDEITNLLLPGSQSSDATTLDGGSTASVLRYKRDVGSRFTLGALATDREGEGYFNRLGGVDADLRFSDTDRLRGQVLLSDTRYPAEVREGFGLADELRDWAGQVVYSHTARAFGAWAAYRDIGPGFRADLGFLPQVDTRHSEIGASYTFYPGDAEWFSEIEVEGQLRHVSEHDGDLLVQDATATFTYIGPMQSHAIVRVGRAREAWNGRTYDLTEIVVHNCMKPGGDTHVYANVTAGDRIDYDGDRPGRRLRLEGGVVRDFGRYLQLDLGLMRERMRVDAGTLFTATLGNATVSYQLSPRTQLRSVFQYSDVERNPLLHADGVEARQRRLFTQLLFSYMVQPQTVLFVGYSDTARGTGAYGLTRSDRTLFVKVGYALMV